MIFPGIPAGYPALFECIATLYREMSNELAACRPQAATMLDGYQEAFDCSVNYRLKLRELVGAYAFPCEQQEIFYFKQIKPLFVAETLYTTYCYHVGMFTGSTACPAEATTLLKRQLQRLSRFKSRNADFLSHLHAGNPSWDRFWFTRAYGNTGSIGFHPEETRGENIVAEYYANLRFRAFLVDQIRLLESGEQQLTDSHDLP